MTTQTQEDKSEEKKEGYDPFDVVFGERKSTTALDWAVLGCLVAGSVGIFKAFGMDTPLGVLLCLLGSVAAFGLVIFAHLRK
ncbi:MAG TPA: hypothetical protein VMF08_07520 [Candidatus Sulfotelmatobacter sp.]|nr:hypothetical protein [Candidatus Sulfotelmatobacter sp.]